MPARGTLSQSDRKAIFLLGLKELDGNMSGAATMAGVTRQTAYNWMKEDEEFRVQVNGIKYEIDEAVLDNAEDVLKYWLKQKLDRDVAKWILTKRGAGRGYGTKVVVQHEGDAFRGLEFPEEPESVEAWAASGELVPPSSSAQEGT